MNRDFAGGPVVENLPSNTGDASVIPGQETKIPHAAGQPSPFATAGEPVCHNLRTWHMASPTHSSACAPQPEKPTCCNWRKPTCPSEQPGCHDGDPVQP